MKKISYFITFFLLLIFFIGSLWAQSHWANDASVAQRLSRIDQNPEHYVVDQPSSPIISPEQQAQLTQTFLKFYFAPWQDSASLQKSKIQVSIDIQSDVAKYSQQPGWGYDGHPITSTFIKELVANSNLARFAEIDQPAIIVHTTMSRIFPTLLPSYGDPSQGGEGYPFDNWTSSLMASGTPVRVLQSSQDQAWYLVQTASYYGWVQRQDVGFVSTRFIGEWESHPYVVALHDHANLRKGLLYPWLGDHGALRQILIAVIDAAGNAQVDTLSVAKAQTHPFPLKTEASAIAQLAQDYMGAGYGWGGLYELRDCSSTTADLLASFSLWLPRNSGSQTRIGEHIDLTGMSNKEKTKIIQQKAIPFFTLIHFPGHIALYLGAKAGKIYVLQNVWGLHTRKLWGHGGRVVIGKTIISPLDFGKEFVNTQQTLLDSADSLSILTPQGYKDDQRILTQVWQ